MRKFFLIIMCAIGTVALTQEGRAQFNYELKVGTGSATTGSFSTITSGSRYGARGGHASFAVNIGFTFPFNGTNYTQVSIGTGGLILFGNASAATSSNSFSNIPGPGIAPFWDDMRVTDGSGGYCTSSAISYLTTGSAPNRVFVVVYDKMGMGTGDGYGRRPLTVQARLYETSGRIEFYYPEIVDGKAGSCDPWGAPGLSTSATIGIAADKSNFISVTPGSGSSKTKSDNSVNVGGTSIQAGTLYTFCPAGLFGDVNEGGTATMKGGDTLLLGKEVVVTSSASFKPFSLFNQCASSISYTITGPSASEYSISPASGPLTSSGSNPTLTFSPTALGKRYATLVVEDGDGLMKRSYVLAGEGVPRVKWIGNVSQGGTPNVENGDDFFQGYYVENNTTQSFTPLTIEVANSPGPLAPVTYQLRDFSGGTFSIDRTTDNIAPGNSASVVITIAPDATVGPQRARLIVNAESEIREFDLEVFSSGAGATFAIKGSPLLAGASIFRNVYECVGEGINVVEIDITSIGDEPFIIESDSSFVTETEIRQGTPPYPVFRDRDGNLVPADDYYIADASGNRLQLPTSILPGNTRTIFLGFSPTRPGSRRSRSFFGTNGENFFGLNTDNQTTEGVLNFELVGHGLGATLSNPEKDGLPKPVVFDVTEVRETSTMTGMIYNDGQCDLKIDTRDFRIVSGDVEEFKLLGPIYGVQGNGTSYVVPPGDTAMFDVSFTPSRSGSRIASVRVVTNDSALFLPGLSERGTFYIDLYGKGKVGLEGRDIFIAPAVIDGPSSRGVARIENNSGELVRVTNVAIAGSTEIVEDPQKLWPATPFNVEPGKSAELGLALIPDAGSAPGTRTATLEVTLDNGDVLILDISGIAGTRTLAVIPTTLFNGVQVAVGEIARRFVAVNNNGTLPVRIDAVQVAGAGAADYTVGALARRVVQPGGTDFIEVTYEPMAAGASDATLTVTTNSTNATPTTGTTGTHVVTLGAAGVSTAREGGETGDPAVRPNAVETGWATRTASGVALWQGTPNPTSANVAIRYYTPSSQNIVIELFNTEGQKVMTLMNEVVDGAGELKADLSDLPSGRYFYMLRTAEGPLTLSIDLVR